MSMVVGFRPVSLAMLPVAIVFIFLIALLFTALGTAIASVLEDMQGFQLIMNFLVMPLFFLSGALFPLNGTPSLLSRIAMYNPLTYGVDALRATLSGASQIGLFFDFLVIGGAALLFLIIGSYLFSKIEI
jgi:ABC-2 type transport system permease protein